MLALFCILGVALGRIDVIADGHKEKAIKAGKLSPFWQYTENSGEPCRPGPAVFSQHTDDSFKILVDGDDQGKFFHIRAYASGIKIDSEEIDVNEYTKQFNVTYTCQPETVWSNVILELEFEYGKNYKISYVRICNADGISRFDWGHIFLLVCTIVVVASAAQQVAKFEVLEDEESPELQTHHAIAFVVVGSIALLVIFFLLYYANIALTVVISISACSAITLILGELLGYLP